MIDADPFEHDDAAYVMGMLSPVERAVFEAHLKICDACSERVRELRPTTELLASISADELHELELAAGDDDPLPDTLLPGLLRQAGVRRRRGRQLMSAISSLGAACLIALIAVLWPGGAAVTAESPRVLSVLAATPLRASAAVTNTMWGTRISLDCNYGYAPGDAARRTYGLTLVTKDGSRERLGTWTVAADAHTKFISGTALPAAAIRTIEITSSSGMPLLALNL